MKTHHCHLLTEGMLLNLVAAQLFDRTTALRQIALKATDLHGSKSIAAQCLSCRRKTSMGTENNREKRDCSSGVRDEREFDVV